ncbi:hypothetical protein HELRODRAFT_192685 [Helobdella robusta]|uniref:Uncharacterized protein n=1 Tax=Helobdella robusta TaxID=6412 RepID=T1FU69_HELRO|nr:hypothetical protein HELRODRAFT_192685 [Helobdella robusta]ESN99992.1 hypothetical protein HELRODRAFT_192685 [Helobdella robusta]
MSDGSRKYYACAVVSQPNGPDIESYQVGFKLVGGLAFDSSPWYLAEPFEMNALSIFDQIICPFSCKFRCCCCRRCRRIRQKSVDRSKPIALKKLHLNENLSNKNINNRNINDPFLTEPLTSAVDINYVTTFGSVSGSFCINRRVFIPRDEAHVTCCVDNHSSRDLVCSISLHQVISFRADHCEGGSEEDSSRKVLFMKRHMQLQRQPIKEVTKITDNNLIQTSNLSVQAGDSTSFGFRFQVPTNLTYSDASSFNCDDGSKKSSESSSQALLNASNDVVDVIVIRYFCMLQILPTKEKTKAKEKYLAPIEVWMARR